MATPSSTTEQSQGGSDVSVTSPLKPGKSQSTSTTLPYVKRSSRRARPDFTITFVITPTSSPSGRPIL